MEGPGLDPQHHTHTHTTLVSDTKRVHGGYRENVIVCGKKETFKDLGTGHRGLEFSENIFQLGQWTSPNQEGGDTYYVEKGAQQL